MSLLIRNRLSILSLSLPIFVLALQMGCDLLHCAWEKLSQNILGYSPVMGVLCARRPSLVPLTALVCWVAIQGLSHCLCFKNSWKSGFSYDILRLKQLTAMSKFYDYKPIQTDLLEKQIWRPSVKDIFIEDSPCSFQEVTRHMYLRIVISLGNFSWPLFFFFSNF